MRGSWINHPGASACGCRVTPPHPGRGVRAVVIICVAFAFWLPVAASAQVPLFTDSGPQPGDVVQGRLGSCYFHASMAALSVADPSAIVKMIRPGLLPRTYRVSFPDGASEVAYSGDITYARENQYDQSRALWVPVLFRAYGQRVLRNALQRALQKTTLSTYVKEPLLAILKTDLPILAYDRTIRAEIVQDGSIDAGRLKSALRKQLQPLPLSAQMKDSLLTLMDSRDFFLTVAEAVKENGEVFGAYRAVGNGGLPQRVLTAFLGHTASTIRTTSPDVRTLLAAKLPAIAATYPAAPSVLPADSDRWYVESHAYTVVRFDPASDTVFLRNPWGRKPDPDGVLPLPFNVFAAAFEVVTVGTSAGK